MARPFQYETLENRTFWRSVFKWEISKMASKIVLTILIQTKRSKFQNAKYKMPTIFVGFQMIGLLYFRSQLKSKPLANWPIFQIPTVLGCFQMRTVYLTFFSTTWMYMDDPTYNTTKEFSGDLKSRNIWNPDFLKVRFQMIWFSNGRALVTAIGITIAIAITIPITITIVIALITTIWNPGIFVWISNHFWQNGGHLFRFQMVGLLAFRSHSKSRPFATQPLLTIKLMVELYFKLAK